MSKRKVTITAAAAAAAFVSFLGAPRVAKAYRSWKAEQRQARIAQAWESVKRGQDYLTFNPIAEENEGAEEAFNRLVPEQDDPMLRGLVNAAEWGYPSAAASAQKLAVARAEAQKNAHLFPKLISRAGQRLAPNSVSVAVPTGTPVWKSLGPTDVAKKEYNGDEYTANDSGRGQGIRPDPLDPTGNTIYFAVSGGGIWRTTNFKDPTPTWVPLTDTLGNLSIGAFDLFPGADPASHTLWVGLGDFTDAPSGLVVFSRDSGATWSQGIQLTGRYSNGVVNEPQLASPATRIRDIRVDPNQPDVVLVATDMGLYRSTNGTSANPTFALIDLPNAGAGNLGLLKESAWTFAFLGSANPGPSNWLVSGVTATASAATAYLNLPPGAGGGGTANLGDIWLSTDAGATWSSLRAANKINAGAFGLAQEPGRMALAAGTPVAGDPTQTTVYVQVSNANEAAAASVQLAILKTKDSGGTWQLLAKNTDTAQLANPTFGTGDCNNMNTAHNQAWYNLAIAVDPADSQHAILGGNLCSISTINGGITWRAVSDWLPLPNFGLFGVPQGNTDPGLSVYLPYVHADWHTITIANGTVYAGTDGGMFASSADPNDPTSVFTNSLIDATHMPVKWRQVNTGLVTHLMYSIASGDPVIGNHRFAFTGLQDNGTRMRDSGTSTKWNQVVGGDGVAAAISVWDDGSHQVFFHSLPGRRQFCRPGEPFFISEADAANSGLPGWFDPPVPLDCNQGLMHPNQGTDNLISEWTTWNPATNPNLPNGDGEPFLLRVIPVNDGKGSMFTISNQFAWKMTIDDRDIVNYQAISNIFANRFGTPAIRTPRGMIQVSPWTYQTTIPAGSVGPADRTITSRLYGVPLAGGFFYVGVENTFSNNNFDQVPWAWTSTRNIMGSTGAGGPLQQMTSTSSIDFPHDPTHLGGAAPGLATDLLNTYIVSSVTPADVANQLIRDDVGRIFKTIDGGATFTSIAPVSSGMPNVPVDMVRFDPGDPTDKTIFAGTDIGVYVTRDGGTTWQRYGFGLPMVRVVDMSFARNGSLLRIATYGRGIWEISPHDQAPVALGKPDWDNNGTVDFLDLGAMASRLGTAPNDGSTRYENTIDTDQSGSLDDADLTTLLAKYGSTP